jgi:hypothetical protein
MAALSTEEKRGMMAGIRERIRPVQPFLNHKHMVLWMMDNCCECKKVDIKAQHSTCDLFDVCAARDVPELSHEQARRIGWSDDVELRWHCPEMEKKE